MPSAQGLLVGWIVVAALLVPVQLFITAPYGRHANRRWGPVVSNRLAWVTMESVALLAFWLGFLWFSISVGTVSSLGILVAFLWSVHYVNRALIYPRRMRANGKFMPLLIMLFACLFNGVNGVANGAYAGLSEFGATGQTEPLRMCVGVAVFCVGMAINMWADHRLLNMRSAGESGYVLPTGGLFDYVSCPNFLGEIIEWIGFAILCWNLPAFAFALWTMANLVPRALSHHAWYKAEFAQYPGRRRALVPFVL